MSRPNTSRSGFTLIELLVVIAIIGLLSSIAYISFARARINARNVLRFSTIQTIVSGLQLYFIDNDQWPYVEDLNDLSNYFWACRPGNPDGYPNVQMCIPASGPPPGETGVYCSTEQRCRCYKIVEGVPYPNQDQWLPGFDEYFSTGYTPHDPQENRCPASVWPYPGNHPRIIYRGYKDTATEKVRFELFYWVESSNAQQPIGTPIGPCSGGTCVYKITGDPEGSITY